MELLKSCNNTNGIKVSIFPFTRTCKLVATNWYFRIKKTLIILSRPLRQTRKNSSQCASLNNNTVDDPIPDKDHKKGKLSENVFMNKWVLQSVKHTNTVVVLSWDAGSYKWLGSSIFQFILNKFDDALLLQACQWDPPDYARAGRHRGKSICKRKLIAQAT